MRQKRRILSITVASVFFLAIACTRSLRQDALQTAKFGSTTAQQMADYYGVIQKYTIDTYELDQFREAYLRQLAYNRAKEKGEQPATTPSFEFTQVDRDIQELSQKTYDALGARSQLALAMKDAYDAYVNLASYDSTQEVLGAVSGLTKAAVAVSSLPLPDPTGTITGLAQGILKDIITELTTIQQNKKLVQQSEKLIPALEKLKKFFDTEQPLCGGDYDTKDSAGNIRHPTGIAGRKSAAYESAARVLVEGEVVISTAFVNRVLEQYQLKWPEPQAPFAQSALKAGVIKMIEGRSHPIGRLADDTANQLSRSLGKLITLHNELKQKKPLSWTEALNNSATAQLLLNRMKSQGAPVDSLVQVMTLLQGGQSR